MWLWLMKIPSQYQLIMPKGQLKAMWQCMWDNLVANFGTNASGETSCPNFEPMQIMVTQFATDTSGSFWWPNLQSVQVAPPGGQNCKQWMIIWLQNLLLANGRRRHLVVKFATNSIGAKWWYRSDPVVCILLLYHLYFMLHFWIQRGRGSD